MFPDTERYKWFERHCRTIIERCRRTAGAVPGFLDEPVTVYVPGGDDKYPSFWVRDAVMQCRCGVIDAGLMQTMLRVILSFQNGPDSRQLANGLRIGPWAVADHINLPGLGNEEFQRAYPPGPVFFPGSYCCGDSQGDGSYGLRPPDDDIAEAVELAALIVDSLGTEEAASFLSSEVKDLATIERLHRGMQAAATDENTGLFWNTPGDWAASDFHDALKPMGAVALTSCLRFRAARRMARFCELLGDEQHTREYESLSERIARSVTGQLVLADGWVMVASETDRQPDVWSTSMAVYYGILTGDLAQKACEAMLKSYRDGAVGAFGYLRHTPTTADVVPGKQVWEHGETPGQGGYGTYQNGGYWPQPLGYYVYCLARVDEKAAKQMAVEFIDHTRSHIEEGAPFEWLNPAIRLADTPGLGRWYGPSAALPLEGFRRLS